METDKKDTLTRPADAGRPLPQDGRGELISHRLLWVLLAILMLACLPVDHAVAYWASTVPENFHQAARFISMIGRSVWILIPFGSAGLVLFAASLRWRRFLQPAKLCSFVFVCVGASGLVVNAIKPFFGRPRPNQWLANPEILPQPFSGSAKFASFPSGHTDAAMALALSLGVYFPRFRLPLIGWTIIMGLSRIIANDHYPSDVFGGALIGALTTLWLTHLARNRGWFNRPPAPDRGRA